jgi:HAMP domain-containing protein
MQAASAIRIEENVDRAASAMFAAACAYAAYSWLGAQVGPMPFTETFAAAAFGYVLVNCLLGSFQPDSRRLPVPVFDVREIESAEPEELLLTERRELPELLLTERHDAPASSEPLWLDDILAKLSSDSDSRVVRLFDPAKMPTPGQLKSKIDDHLDQEATPQQHAEGVQALHEALAELRRSLR